MMQDEHKILGVQRSIDEVREMFPEATKGKSDEELSNLLRRLAEILFETTIKEFKYKIMRGER